MPISMTPGISIQQFQALSSGKYNAGELTLDKNGKLSIVNNHVVRKSLNNKTVDAQTALEVKKQFVRALVKSGINIVEERKIRKELGLPERDRPSLVLAPLTREKAREILDRYAGKINEKVPGAIPKPDPAKCKNLEKLAAKRAEVNAETLQRRNKTHYAAMRKSRNVTHERAGCIISMKRSSPHLKGQR